MQHSESSKRRRSLATALQSAATLSECRSQYKLSRLDLTLRAQQARASCQLMPASGSALASLAVSDEWRGRTSTQILSDGPVWAHCEVHTAISRKKLDVRIILLDLG